MPTEETTEETDSTRDGVLKKTSRKSRHACMVTHSKGCKPRSPTPTLIAVHSASTKKLSTILKVTPSHAYMPK